MSTSSNSVRLTDHARALRRTMAGVAAVVVASLATACVDAPSAPATPSPADAPSLAKGGSPAKVGRFGESDTLRTPVVATALLRTSPLRTAVSASFTVKGAGGRFELPGTGLSVIVPPGALPKDQPLTIRVTAPAGDVVAYEFEPHGTQFNKALQMRQDLRGTNWSRRLAGSIDVGYFARSTDLSLSRKTALVHEALRTGLDATGQHVDFDVIHFSGYMVSWGFHAWSNDAW